MAVSGREKPLSLPDALLGSGLNPNAFPFFTLF